MISVVIPAYNEERYLSSMLETLAQQKTQHEYEVIVVDNASTDATANIARSFSKKLQLRVISESRRGRGRARATGFEKAKGEIVLSTDADVLLPPDWIEKMVAPFSRQSISGTSSLLITYDLSAFDNNLYALCDWLYMWIYRVLFGNHTVVGCSFGLRKSVYTAAGGFNTDLRAQEDVELGWKLRKKGQIVLVPGVRPQVSGRRFRHGIVNGFLEYTLVLFQIGVMNRSDADLQDIR